MKPEDRHIKAVIIGLWRMGATNGQIAHELNLTIDYVKQVIYDYSHEIPAPKN